MPAPKNSQYLCIIAKTKTPAKTAFRSVFAWACAGIARDYPAGSTSVFFEASNDYGDEELFNDIVVVFRNNKLGGFSLETVEAALKPRPPVVESVQVACITEAYAKATRDAGLIG